jgi:hypothetical protein
MPDVLFKKKIWVHFPLNRKPKKLKNTTNKLFIFDHIIMYSYQVFKKITLKKVLLSLLLFITNKGSYVVYEFISSGCAGV